MVRQADDFFVCFGAKPNKGLSLRSPTRLEAGEERQVQKKPRGAVGKRAQKRWVGKGRSRETVDIGQRKEAVRKAVKDELAFLVAFVGVSWKIYAHDSLQNARKAIQKCHKTTLLALGADISPHCSFVLFLTLPRLYFLWL